MWAPEADAVEVELDAGGAIRFRPLERDEDHGTWVAVVDGIGHGHRYRFRLDGDEPLADPASGWQPEGVHGASAVVDATPFVWTDDGWSGVTLHDTVCYELHVGTFTPGGTLDAAIEELPRLAQLGITSIELMPLNAFPGGRNWGYDGVFPSAVQHSYGGPEALARFVDAAHAHGLAVVLDVVYNHVGPEGSVLRSVRAVLHRRLPHPVGRRHQRRRGRAATTSGGRSSRAPPGGSRTSTSTGCGSTPST